MESENAKFKVGGWIISNSDMQFNIIAEITSIRNSLYYIRNIYGNEGYETWDSLRDNYHVWTIQDAKSGDVLYTPKGCGVEGVFLIEGWKQVDNTGRTLCSNVGYRIEDDEIIVGGLGAIWWEGVIDPFYPATNEQKELLFEKIRENGYEYDSKKNRCIRKKAPEEYAIIINGVRHNLIKPQIEDCGKCSLDKFCDNFKEALCNSLVGGNTGMIFEKENSNKTKV